MPEWYDGGITIAIVNFTVQLDYTRFICRPTATGRLHAIYIGLSWCHRMNHLQFASLIHRSSCETGMAWFPCITGSSHVAIVLSTSSFLSLTRLTIHLFNIYRERLLRQLTLYVFVRVSKAIVVLIRWAGRTSPTPIPDINF